MRRLVGSSEAAVFSVLVLLRYAWDLWHFLGHPAGASQVALSALTACGTAGSWGWVVAALLCSIPPASACGEPLLRKG